MSRNHRPSAKRLSAQGSPAQGNEQRTHPTTRRNSSISVLSSLFSGHSGLSRLLGLDGYSNAAAFLGDDSPLLSSGTFRRSNLTSRTELLTTAYRESWLAKKIIDMPSEDMTRAWYTLSTRMSEDCLRALRRLEGRHSIRQEITNAIRWARLYGGSCPPMSSPPFRPGSSPGRRPSGNSKPEGNPSGTGRS